MHQMIAERILFLSYPYLIISTPSFLNLPPTGLLNNLDCAWPQHTAYLTKKRKKKKFNEPLWQDYSVCALLQQMIYAHSKYYFGSMNLTSTSVRLPWFQSFSTENKMNSSNDSAGEKLCNTESNSTCIQVKQVPIFPHGWCSKDCQVGSVVLYFSFSSTFVSPLISSLVLNFF